jgi:photosystem II stability/assembly factor-like uncharacterized protein
MPGAGRYGSKSAAVFFAVVGIVLSMATPSSASVFSGHSGWFWGSPQPQGNDLSGLDFVGSRGYAAGAFGTLLRTDDAGATWTAVDTGLTDPLVRVRVIDANTVLVGGGCALRRSDDGGQSFSRLPWTASDAGCPSPIASFFFASGSVGYLTTKDGSIFRTADGGQTFSRQTSVPGTSSAGGSREPADIYFTSDNTGVAVTRGSGGGKIFRTTDAGISWVDVGSPPSASNPFNGVTFTSANDGVAVGNGNTFMVTADGGATWTPKPLTGAPVQDLVSVDCSTATTCIATEGNGHLMRTTDGGATGADITPSTGKVLATAFSSPTRVVAVGQQGGTVISDDGGVNFSPLGGAVSGAAFQRLRATSASIANVGAANGTLIRTTNGGANWSAVGVPTNATVLDASFADQATGYAIDAFGGAFKTVNGGTSWQILNTGTTDLATGVYAVSPTTVLLSGRFAIRRSTNSGALFEPVPDKDLKGVRLTNVLAAGTAVLAYGTSALRVSSDQGQTWSTIPLPKKTKIDDASFVSSKVGFILTKGQAQVMRTNNGGRTWKDLPAIATSSVYRISFATATEGFIAAQRFGDSAFGANGLVLHTTDGGVSWQPQLVAADAPADIWDAGGTSFMVTPGGQFFATNNGGSAGTHSALTLKQLNTPKKKPSGTVKVSGTLSPAEGGEQITIMYRDRRVWRSRTEVAASDGTFTSEFKVQRATVAVAQWLGDDTRSGAGTAAIKITPAKK